MIKNILNNDKINYKLNKNYNNIFYMKIKNKINDYNNYNG